MKTRVQLSERILPGGPEVLLPVCLVLKRLHAVSQ